MNTTDNKENNIEIKTETLLAKKVSASVTHQLHVVIHPDINGFRRLFGGRLLEWIDEVAGATARRHCGRDATTVAIDNLYFKSGAYLNDITASAARSTSHPCGTHFYGSTRGHLPRRTGRHQTPHQPGLFCHGSHGRRWKAHPGSQSHLRERGGCMEWDNAIKRRELRLVRGGFLTSFIPA